MSTMMQRPQLWSVHPGWGIAVDLTPPELLNRRHVRVLRKAVIAGIVAVFVLCVGGYVLAVQRRSDAQDALDTAQMQTSRLHSQTAKYSVVTKIDGTVDQVRAQVAGLMKGDIALDTLLTKVRASVPKGMSIDQLSVTISLATVAPGQGAAAGSIDRTGHVRVGNIGIQGRTDAIPAISGFVDRLEKIPGVVDVVPTSNSLGATGGQYAINLGIDDRLLSHRFDVTKGAK